MRGAPRTLGGVFHVRRGAPAVEVAREWLETSWPELSVALGADASDVVEHVGQSALPSRDVDVVWFRRVRAERPMRENYVEIHVTTDRHPVGGGVVTMVETPWDTDVDAPKEALDEAEAVALASTAFGRPIRDAGRATDLAWRCFHQHSPACRLTWEISDTVELNAEEPFAQEDRPERRANTAYVDAVTGDVLAVAPRARHYTGQVNQTTRYPFDTADTLRDMRLAQLRQFCFFGYCVDGTDTNGLYDWTPPYGTSAQVGLRSRDGADPLFRHGNLPTCAAFNEDPQWQSFGLDVGLNVVMTPNATNNRRNDWMLFHYLNYFADTYNLVFANLIEPPATLWYDAGPGTGGSFVACDGTAEVGVIGVGAQDDTDPGYVTRDVFWEEVFHSTEWCMQTVGAGCGSTNVDPRSALGSSFGHSTGGAIGSRMNQYETWARGANASNHLRFAGANAVGDIMLYDEEIDGTPTSAPNGCNFTIPGVVYNCAADEACYFGGQDRPRCMKRAPNPDSCTTLFPSQPGLLLDRQPYGRSPTETNVQICVSNDYSNGRLWLHLGENLINGAGHFSGVGGLYRANFGNVRTRTFTTGADNYHRAMALWSGGYEASNAFHNVSTEGFPWFDDTTGIASRAEVIRTPRDATLTFSNGGPTATALAFQDGVAPPGPIFDQDVFQVVVDPGEIYEIIATTSSTAVDLCLTVRNHLSGATIAQQTTHPNGCTDGASTAAARNHTYRFSSGSANRINFLVDNLLDQAGTYQIQIRNVNDDYADLLSQHFNSHPLATGAAVSASLNTTSDNDLFRYDAPTSGTLTVTTTGAATTATVDIYSVLSPAAPSGGAAATGTGGATVSMVAGRAYYIHVRAAGVTSGAYTLTATHSGCATCNASGTYTNPIVLPSTTGGTVVNRLDESATTANTWAQCDDGTACDWYQVTLSNNERVSVTTFDVWDHLCDVEVSVFAPDELQYWKSSGIRAPMTYDLFGSMEVNGSQLSFVAPRAGDYRIRVRGIDPGGWDCPRYRMTVSRGAFDAYGPPTIH